MRDEIGDELAEWATHAGLAPVTTLLRPCRENREVLITVLSRESQGQHHDKERQIYQQSPPIEDRIGAGHPFPNVRKTYYLSSGKRKRKAIVEIIGLVLKHVF